MPKHLAEPVSGPAESRHRRGTAGAARPVLRTSKAPTSTRYSLATRRGAPRSRRPLVAAALTAAAALVPASLYVASAAQEDGLLAHDAFARTVATGWGDAAVGGAYTLSVPGAASVRDGAGLLAMRPAATVSAVLRAVDAQDVDARATLAVDGRVGGNGLYASLMVRRQGNHDNYRVLARVTRGGELRLSILRVTGGSTSVLAAETGTGLILAPGTPAVVEGVVTGMSPVVLRARASVGTRTSDWVATTDGTSARIAGSGAVGVSDYLSSASSPVTVRYSGLHAQAVDPVAAPTPSPSATGSAPDTSPSPSGPSTQPSASAPSTSAPSPSTSAPSSAGGRAAARAGAAQPGGTDYPVPAGAVFVAPGGDDSAAGGKGTPLRTLARAVAMAGSGGTVVLRAGSYHENVTVNKRLTIQAYPGEAVWLDGSSTVQGWTAEGGAWAHGGWTSTFDSTPCYNAGSCGSSDPAFQFIDPAHPMAAHPDQVFVDDVPQRQVGSVGELAPGTFYVDYGAQRLYLGTDPRGHRIAASDLSEAVTLRAEGSVLRGIGVRRYGTALPRMGTVRLTGPRQVLEQVTVVDNATTGVVVTAGGAVVKNVTASRNGMLGVGANYADDLTVTGLRAEGNNAEHFKTAPVSGGIKVTRTRGVRIADGAFTNNDGTGVWLDESVYDASVTGSDITRNAAHGISFEISAKGVFADDVITDNGRDGMKINDSEGVRIWNNTLARNSRTIEVVQDGRLASNRSNAGHDPRQAFPDPTMTWLVGKVSIGNNVLGHPRPGANCVLCVEDYSHKRSAAQMDVTEDGNVWTRAEASSPSWLVVWSSGAGNPAVFTTLDAFSRATGQGRHSGDVLGGQPSPAARVALPATAQRLPADVAAALGRDAGEAHLGAWS